jgi:hypothetical protein
MTSTIPANINRLSMAEAFCFYRDQLRWHVFPVYPPRAKTRDAGKHPAVKACWEFDPYDCNIRKWFGGRQPFNIGLGPRFPLVIVDLDSKPAKKVPRENFSLKLFAPNP